MFYKTLLRIKFGVKSRTCSLWMTWWSRIESGNKTCNSNFWQNRNYSDILSSNSNTGMYFIVYITWEFYFCVNRTGFPGSQPVSMDINNIKLMHEKRYFVSWKADGTRWVLTHLLSTPSPFHTTVLWCSYTARVGIIIEPLFISVSFLPV